MPNYELRFFSKQKPCRKSQKLTEYGSSDRTASHTLFHP